jgi:hypothetical protein
MYRNRLMEQRLREALASVPAVVLVGARQGFR